jgi:hypothetical protein
MSYPALNSEKYLAQLGGLNHVRSYSRLVSIYTELCGIQTKLLYIFSLHPKAQREGKEIGV